MSEHDPILAADRLEESFAADRLRKAESTAQLVDAWFAHADHFAGESRERSNAW